MTPPQWSERKLHIPLQLRSSINRNGFLRRFNFLLEAQLEPLNCFMFRQNLFRSPDTRQQPKSEWLSEFTQDLIRTAFWLTWIVNKQHWNKFYHTASSNFSLLWLSYQRSMEFGFSQLVHQLSRLTAFWSLNVNFKVPQLKKSRKILVCLFRCVSEDTPKRAQ